ncbi:hypothetical protein ACEWY4_002837 [Coilia grayii]|uniref:Paralemmin-3 n=1 Tax=Coilia grayii TaxID=363190 RepID=A0ABD1KPZ4_9TELE
MDETEKYQQRLQAIAEKRKQQEEEERSRREVEEEWLQLAQQKRKSLRDHWLMEVPNAAPADSAGPGAPLLAPAQTTEGQANEKGEEGESTAQKEEEIPVQDGRQTNSTKNNTHAPCQVGLYRQGEVEDMVVPSIRSRPIQNGGEDRSVLGMLEVRVEKDLRTGATVIKSVAPLLAVDTPPDGTASERMVFDDGRKSIRAVSASPSEAAQPSAEELGQVLHTLAEVGVPVLLEARGLVVPSDKGRGGREEAEDEKQEEVVEGPDVELEVEAEPKLVVGNTEETKEDRDQKTKEDRDWGTASEPCTRSSQELQPEEEVANIGDERVADVDTIDGKDRDTNDNFVDAQEIEQKEEGEEKEKEEEEGEEEEMFRPEEGLDPITLTFLGFSQVASEPGQGNQDDGSLVRVERVIIHENSDDEDEEEEDREGHPWELEQASPGTEFRHSSSHPALGTQEEQSGAGGPADVASSDPGLYLPTKADWPQTRQGGNDTAGERHSSHEGETTAPARADVTGCAPDGGSPEDSLHLREHPVPGTRTAGTEVEDEMGRGQGAVERESLDEVFQDVDLEDTESQRTGPTLSGQPRRAEAVGGPKHKACQCCSVM